MNKKIITIIVAVVLFGGGYLLFSGSNNDNAEETIEHDVTEEKVEEDKGKDISIPENETVEPLVREIKITAKRFEFDKTEIQVKKGEKVKIVVENTDFPHGIIIPDLVDPSTQTDFNEFEIPTDEAGEFFFYCATPCGAGHGTMTGKIVIS